MVMHARKTQRMNDGYFEKHQAHPYQSSKYSSSKSYGSSSDRYDRLRESPNGNYRSDSPDSQSPRERDRSYQSKNSYLQKIREKERENRDYKSSRDKYSDCARSPKDKRNRDSEHRPSGDDKSVLHPIKMTQNSSSRDRKPMHNNCGVDKRGDDRDRVARVGDWTEHVSSSGKKYYYNCKTEVSQWEKPREWVDRERDRFRTRDRDRDRDSDRSYGGSSGRSNIRHEKHSNSRGPNKDGSGSSRHWVGADESAASIKESSSSRRKQQQQQQHPDEVQQQDMDISPGDSTPTSEISTTAISAPEGPVLLANALPRLVSHHHYATNDTSSPKVDDKAGIVDLAATSSSDNGGPLVVDTINHHHHSGATTVAEGPPTPTHSESADCPKGELEPLRARNCYLGTFAVVGVPAPVTSPPATNVSTLQGVASSLQALRPQGPTITPSLVNYYRDDLVNHVRGWPADILEKQAQKLAEEAHIMGSIQCCKVSAELKSARSLVRLTEIQATLQEQRILFLRQQIRELEELKSQNSFMSDDP